jgi:hypothetical protein
VSRAAPPGRARAQPLVARDTAAYTFARREVVDDTAGIVASTRITSFLGGSLAWQSRSLLVVLGDYTAEFGQGLALSDGRRRFSRSGGSQAPYIAARHIAASRSSDETAFLRGAAVELSIERPLPFRARGALFASRRWLDGAIDSGVVTSIRRDGNHRTISEIRRSANVLERLEGANVTLEREGWSLGLTGVRSALRAEGSPTESVSTVVSLDARMSSRSTTLYAECATSRSIVAAVAGAFVRAGSATFVVAARMLPDSIELPHGRAFPRASEPSAERGLYVGIDASGSRDLSFSLGLDIFRRTRPSALVPFPRSGSSASASLRWSPRRDSDVLFLVARTHEVDRVAIVDGAGRIHVGLLDGDATSARLALEHEPAGIPLALRGRFELRRIDHSAGVGGSLGWLTALDARSETIDGLELRCAIALFDAHDIDAAPSLAEADIPGRVRTLRLNGIGRRISASLRWRPAPWIRASLAWSLTSYDDRRTIGDGLDEIRGSALPTLALQIEATLRSGQ